MVDQRPLPVDLLLLAIGPDEPVEIARLDFVRVPDEPLGVADPVIAGAAAVIDVQSEVALDVTDGVLRTEGGAGLSTEQGLTIGCAVLNQFG